jgi:hypothetical protein
VAVEGIPYPTWTRIGLHAVGERSDVLSGHAIHTVVYAGASGARVGYAIASGEALPLPAGRVVRRHGVPIRVLRVDGAAVVTWRADGHTCILASRGEAPARLVRLVSYVT